ncbi:preprotein translocase subunit Tim44 [Bacterioplanes sanyensis]|uniref:Tim44 domain-containing protein n=1 Tax=Bacterioplanes sanyensis TaxID=1249553 RepID=UPI001679DCD0|nr:Tim44-like domain-containing protein [Bacterioplanes sanyensis]GGY31345.1 preprotein translocase subunit Tim44 [Bacterioplanes sanyensis]
MHLFATLMLSILMVFSSVPDAEAKRLGSGGLGKSQKTTPYKSNDQQTTKQQNQQAINPAKSNSKMPAILGGLLAGGLFAYLLGNGAFEGMQLMDWLLIAGVILVLVKLLKKPQPQARYAHDGPPLQSASDFNHPASASSDIDLPAGFEQSAFLEAALSHYRTLQQAWNDGDMSVIKEYMAPQLCEALEQQRRSLMVPPRTEILDLSADIVRAGRHGQTAYISVLFKGRCKDELERSEDGIFDVWHLERALDESNAPWMVVGIEAE